MAKTKNTRRSNPPEPLPPSNFRWFFGHVFYLLRKHGNAVLFWIGLCYLGNRATVALTAFAGRQSLADLSLKIAGQISAVWTVSVTLSGLAISLYIRERNLHRKTRERLTKRVTELELQINPSRTSSKLTSEGLTREEDM